MYRSFTMRVINKVLRKQKIMLNTRDNIDTLVSWVRSIVMEIYIHRLISSGPFGQTFNGMGKIPNGFIAFSQFIDKFLKG